MLKKSYYKLLLCNTALLLSLWLTGCAWFENQRESADKNNLPIKMLDGKLLLSRSSRPELGLALTNNLDRTLWVSVLFQTPDGLTNCLLSKELSAQTEHFYECPQPRTQIETFYRVQIRVYNDLEQTRLLDERKIPLHFSELE